MTVSLNVKLNNFLPQCFYYLICQRPLALHGKRVEAVNCVGTFPNPGIAGAEVMMFLDSLRRTLTQGVLRLQ
jgi:hypothetical protein